MAKRNNWTKEETIIAFNVYCKVPFKSSSKTHPTIIKYAHIIGRSPSALNMKVGNFGRLDPELRKRGITGLVHGSKLEEEVWGEFNGNWDELAYESELLKLGEKSIQELKEMDPKLFPQGTDRETLVKTRINQSFFRSTVLSSYNTKCCITGLSTPELLVASHIIPWSANPENRTNPHNGLCLNSIHDRAFDRGLITISPDYKVLISDYVESYSQDKAINNLFRKYLNQSIILPDRFLPSKEFLDYHYKILFKK